MCRRWANRFVAACHSPFLFSVMSEEAWFTIGCEGARESLPMHQQSFNQLMNGISVAHAMKLVLMCQR